MNQLKQPLFILLCLVPATLGAALCLLLITVSPLAFFMLAIPAIAGVTAGWMVWKGTDHVTEAQRSWLVTMLVLGIVASIPLALTAVYCWVSPTHGMVRLAASYLGWGPPVGALLRLKQLLTTPLPQQPRLPAVDDVAARAKPVKQPEAHFLD